MTLLETIAQRQTNEVLVSALSITVEKVASEIARELLADPAFKAELKRLTAQSFGRAVQQLHAPPRARRAKATRGRS